MPQGKSMTLAVWL